jgi:hypothetical protein
MKYTAVFLILQKDEGKKTEQAHRRSLSPRHEMDAKQRQTGAAAMSQPCFEHS